MKVAGVVGEFEQLLTKAGFEEAKLCDLSKPANAPKPSYPATSGRSHNPGVPRSGFVPRSGQSGLGTGRPTLTVQWEVPVRTSSVSTVEQGAILPENAPSNVGLITKRRCGEDRTQ